MLEEMITNMMNTLSKKNIFVKILNEDIDVWRPVLASNLYDDVFRVIDKTNFKDLHDEELEFKFGDIVICQEKDNKFIAYKKFIKAIEQSE